MDITVIDFYADWCQPCKSFAPILNKVVEDRGLQLKKINVDDDKDGLSADYKIRSIPTVVVVKNNGEKDVEVVRFTGTKSEGELNSFFDSI